MTFTPTPPTTPGFYAWKSSANSTQPLARYLCELQFYVGLRDAQNGMTPESIGGLWCRLVPAEEVDTGILDAAFEVSHFSKTNQWPEFGSSKFAEFAGLLDALDTKLRQWKARRVAEGDET